MEGKDEWKTQSFTIQNKTFQALLVRWSSCNPKNKIVSCESQFFRQRDHWKDPFQWSFHFWGIRSDGLIQGRKTDSLGPVTVSDMGKMGNCPSCYLVGWHERPSPSHCVCSPLFPPLKALNRRIWLSIVTNTKHPIHPTPLCRVFCPERQTGFGPHVAVRLWMQQGQQCSDSWMKRSHSPQNTLQHKGQAKTWKPAETGRNIPDVEEWLVQQWLVSS